MKIMKSFAVTLTVCALASAALSDVHALCSVPGTSFTSDYFYAPIAQDELLTTGTFWSLGRFNPASPGGDDNGVIPSPLWVRHTSPGGFYLAGDWAADLYDGCIQDPPNVQPARMAAVWTTSDGDDSYYVAMCAVEDANGTFNTFTELGPGNMFRVPKPVIHSSVNNGITLFVNVGHEPFVGSGVLLQGGCPLAITAFKVYSRSVPRGSPAPGGPGSRSPGSGWVEIGQAFPDGDVAGQLACNSASDLYLMVTLVLDNNVVLQQGSRNSTRIECGPNLATPSGDGADGFRLIRRPKSSKQR